uniref:Uncharacterized protein n=1 Tax=Arundo donax TaxID=35708 RepID=A0A0A9DC41_ARUDO
MERLLDIAPFTQTINPHSVIHHVRRCAHLHHPPEQFRHILEPSPLAEGTHDHRARRIVQAEPLPPHCQQQVVDLLHPPLPAAP